MRWDPDTYLAYADERARPFRELLSRVPTDGAAHPADHPVAAVGTTAPPVRRVVDLGCGPGTLTAALAARWPDATVEGVDSSPEMVDRARAQELPSAVADRLRWRVADLRDWRAEEPVDVLVSHATLQWVPGHLDLLAGLVEQVRPGGWLAIQVPGNFEEPSHVLRRELAAEEPYAAHTRGVATPDAFGPAVYLRELSRLGCAVDAWETTYLHVLTGEDPVFGWVSGTGARPTLQALPPGLRAEFETELKARLRAAYPVGAVVSGAVVLPFRRVFVVARTGPAGGPDPTGHNDPTEHMDPTQRAERRSNA
jgi:trans-aconitate 2-methyltransferase